MYLKGGWSYESDAEKSKKNRGIQTVIGKVVRSSNSKIEDMSNFINKNPGMWKKRQRMEDEWREAHSPNPLKFDKDCIRAWFYGEVKSGKSFLARKYFEQYNDTKAIVGFQNDFFLTNHPEASCWLIENPDFEKASSASRIINLFDKFPAQINMKLKSSCLILCRIILVTSTIAPICCIYFLNSLPFKSSCVKDNIKSLFTKIYLLLKVEYTVMRKGRYIVEWFDRINDIFKHLRRLNGLFDL